MMEQLRQRMSQHADVPCGSCSACCKKDTIKLGPKDDLSLYKWHLENGVPVLDRKANGECIYHKNGCSIHASRPDVCKRFDCRVLFLITPKDKRRIRVQQNPTMRNVYDAGKRRLSTLEL